MEVLAESDETTNDPKLHFEDATGLKPPYNRSLAKISLRPDANYPDEGYPVHVSCNFSSQIIELEAGITEFEIIFEIYEAEILLSKLNSGWDYGDHFHKRNSAANQFSTISLTEENKQNINVDLNSSNFGISGNRGSSRQKRMVSTEINTVFEHVSIDQVKLGKRTSNVFLDGQVLRDYCGWYITPNSLDEPSGILAELCVEEKWVKFKSPKTEATSSLGLLWNKVSNSKLKEHAKKKELFADLLKRLALIGLRNKDRPKSAILDVAALAVVPKDNKIVLVPQSQASTPMLQVNELDLINFLECEHGTETQFITNIVSSTKKNVIKEDKVFMPQSGVAGAMNAFENLAEFSGQMIATEMKDLEKKFGRNETRDLISLGFIIQTEGEFRAKLPKAIDKLEEIFRTAISRQSTIRFTRNLIEVNEQITGKQIGVETGKHLNRNWKDWTNRSNGHRLRSWTVFAYENLLFSDENTHINSRLWAINTNKNKKYRSNVLNETNIEEFKKLRDEGCRYKDIAFHFGVSVGALKNFRKKHGLFDAHFKKRRMSGVTGTSS